MFAYNVAHFVKRKKKQGQEEGRKGERKGTRERKRRKEKQKTPPTTRHLITSEWYFNCLRVWGDRMQHVTLCNVAEVNIWAAEEK